MGHNYDKSMQRLGLGFDILFVNAKTSGNVRLSMKHVPGETFLESRKKRSTFTFIPVDEVEEDSLRLDIRTVTTIDGRRVTVTTFDSGRVFVSLEGKWLIGRITTKHRVEGYLRYTLVPA